MPSRKLGMIRVLVLRYVLDSYGRELVQDMTPYDDVF
jgi:hypothetical protein